MLIVRLSDSEYKLYYSNSFEFSDRLVIDNAKYYLDSESLENNGFIGFFDWLRHDESSIVGIRVCFFDHHGYNELFLKLPYIKSSFENKCMEIIFGEAGYNVDISGDQDFSQNYVYKSAANDYLITFNLDHLTEKEFSGLLKYCSQV